MGESSERRPSRLGSERAIATALLAAMFLAALTLRPQLVGAAPLLPSIQEALGLSHAATGLLGTIPVLCMGLFAPSAPIIAARLGTHRSITLSVALIGGFGLARVVAIDGLVFLLLTIGLGVGMGMAGVLVPVFVKEQLRGRAVAGTVAYSSGLQLGAAASAALAVPLAAAIGGWRGSLAMFSLLTLGLVGAWLVLTRRRAPVAAPSIRLARAAFADRRGWLLAVMFGLFGTVYYGFISWLADAYVEAGWSATAAGQLVAILNVAALGGALSVGIIDRLVGSSRTLIAAALGFAVAAVGFVALPGLGWVWAVLAGYTNGALFPLVLALPLRLVRTSGEVAGLSTVMLGVGYSLAAFGPIGLGAVRDATGGFAASLGVLAVAATLFAASVAFVGRWPRTQAGGAASPGS